MRKSNVSTFLNSYAVTSLNASGVSDNVLDNDQLNVDFKPLYQCIHIYTALDALEELQKSYQADRKVLSKSFYIAYILLNPFLISGAVGPHPTDTAQFSIAARTYSGNNRFLHHRARGLTHDPIIPERA